MTLKFNLIMFYLELGLNLYKFTEWYKSLNVAYFTPFVVPKLYDLIGLYFHGTLLNRQHERFTPEMSILTEQSYFIFPSKPVIMLLCIRYY